MASFSRTVGVVLLTISLLAVLQTVREIALWEYAGNQYEAHSVQERTVVFGGHRIAITDDQPVESVHSYASRNGLAQLTVDETLVGPPARAEVRSSLRDIGRYYSWYDLWVFETRDTRDSSLYVVRRLQPHASDAPRFEIIVFHADGTHQAQVLSAWRLGWDYRVFRSTRLISQHTWTVMPLALGGLIGFFPLALIVFPIGTAFLGSLLLWKARKAKAVAPAA